jgi:PKD repeat protein/glucose/arabinose dehydrogenase
MDFERGMAMRSVMSAVAVRFRLLGLTVAAMLIGTTVAGAPRAQSTVGEMLSEPGARSTLIGARAEALPKASSLPAGFHESIVFGGLTNPTAVRFASNGQVFVAEKSGLIKVFSNLDDQDPSIFADLRTAVHNYWDRGLLGLELDPNYPAQPYVYVSYTYDFDPNTPAQFPRWGVAGAVSDDCPTPPGPTTDGCVVLGRVSRLTATGNPPVLSSELVLIQDWCQQFPSHTLGSLRFGAEGALYASGGDGASFTFVDYGQTGVPLNPCGDPPAQVGGAQSPPSAEGGALRSQDLRTSADPASLNGTVIRIDPSTGAAWPTNPLVGSADPNARRIIAYGLRNPFRFVRRPGTNELWIGDVGWGDWEEINLINDTNDGIVENFGWPCYEGNARQAGYDAAGLTLCETLYAQPTSVTNPYYQYRHVDKVVPGENCPSGSSSISGIAFEFHPPGGSYPPEYDNAMFFADYSRNCIWVMFAGTNGRPNPGNLRTFVDGASGPVDLQIGPDGDLFYVDLNGGTLRRVQFLGTNHPPIAVATASPTSGVPPLTVQFDGRGSSDPDGDPITFDWDLDGDGAFNDSTSATPTYTYTTPGTRIVTLRVTDSEATSTITTIDITAQGANLAFNRPVSASSIYGAGLEAAKAVDGNGSTRWSSRFSDPQWLMVDLGATYTVTNVKLYWEAAYGRAYRIEISADATTWTTIYDTITGDGGLDDITDLSGTGRYVRVFGTARGTKYGYSLWEFEVYGFASAGNSPPVAVASASPTTGPTPLTVQFDGRNSSDPDGDPITFDWDLDSDGAFNDSTSATPAYTYTTPGARVVGLRVTDSRAASTDTTITITAQGGNLALNGPASASSIYGVGFEAAKAVDGSGSTRWSSRFSDPQWLMVDLGATYTVTGVKLSWEAAYGRAYRIEVSADATTWTTIYTTTTGDGGVDDINGLSGTGRYVRMFGTARGTPYGYSLWEFEVYGTAPTNARPVATIATPDATLTWQVGEVISFSGSATDPEDGSLPSSALSWSLVLQHCPSTCHTHALQSWPGVSSGWFSAPDHDYPSYLELTLTATDSRGGTGTSVVRLDPKTVQLGFETSPSGLQLVVGTTAATAPFARTVILGSTNSINAPSPQTSGSGTFDFVSWSDGGARTHNIVANAATTYTATFVDNSPTFSNVRSHSLTSSAAISWITGNFAFRTNK